MTLQTVMIELSCVIQHPPTGRFRVSPPPLPAPQAGFPAMTGSENDALPPFLHHKPTMGGALCLKMSEHVFAPGISKRGVRSAEQGSTSFGGRGTIRQAESSTICR
jgi:hypothetical protein